MKKIFVLLLVSSLTFSCKNDKTKEKVDREKTSMDKDAPGKETDKTDKTDVTSPANDAPDEQDASPRLSSDGGWKQSERDVFIKSCTNSAVGQGMNKYTAQSYCECMCGKLEAVYPNAADMNNVTTGELQQITMKYAKGCLEEH